MSSVLTLYAVIDLGSNSFRMVIAAMHNGRAVVVQELKETLRVGAALDSAGNINLTIQTAMLECLTRFKECIHQNEVDQCNVRVVATHVFRQAPNASEVLTLLESTLGYPIHVITGEEEARLIFRGVIKSLPPSDEKRLIVDIGGGSTECIVGCDTEISTLCSVKMGCVSWTKSFFDHPRIVKKAFYKAELAAAQRLKPFKERIAFSKWDVAYASAGTLRMVMEVLSFLNFTQRNVTLTVLNCLREQLVNNGSVAFLSTTERSVSQLGVLPGGVALLIALMKTLEIEEIFPTEGALQLGVLYDLSSLQESYELHEKKHLFHDIGVGKVEGKQGRLL